jgi:predicted pyridoxine 5'-phosphate oxidase superfamily flavin-nucleotide-binding protein
MAKQFQHIEPAHRDFILRQRVFFTGSAAADGRVNVSPKGMDTLRVLDERTVAWLDLTGSGAETAAHVRASRRLTLMFCAFEGRR